MLGRSRRKALPGWPAAKMVGIPLRNSCCGFVLPRLSTSDISRDGIMRNIELLVAASELRAMGASAQLQKSSKAHNENRRCRHSGWMRYTFNCCPLPVSPYGGERRKLFYGSCGDFPPFEFWRTDGFGAELAQSHVQDAMGRAESIPPRAEGVTLELSILEGRRLRKTH